ncbi:MAG: hypothetical protein ACI9KN_000566 [Gammaproteobacteria bacterium]|jgi:hypothetical protein
MLRMVEWQGVELKLCGKGTWLRLSGLKLFGGCVLHLF